MAIFGGTPMSPDHSAGVGESMRRSARKSRAVRLAERQCDFHLQVAARFCLVSSPLSPSLPCS